MFSLADFNQDMGAESAEDDALYDEDVPEEGQSGGANTKGAINQGRTKGGNFQIAPEDDIAPADRDEFRNDNEVQENFPVRVQVHITRKGKGALTISCIADGGELEIEDIFSYTKPELAEAKTAEHEFAGRNVYTGPPFGQLDEGLQELLESYLEERGINTAMALFIPGYIDMKEQKEYVKWLKSKWYRIGLAQSVLTTSRHEDLLQLESETSSRLYRYVIQVLCIVVTTLFYIFGRGQRRGRIYPALRGNSIKRSKDRHLHLCNITLYGRFLRRYLKYINHSCDPFEAGRALGQILRCSSQANDWISAGEPHAAQGPRLGLK